MRRDVQHRSLARLPAIGCGVVDAAGDDEFGLQRPGSRVLVDDAAYDASRAAYETMVADTSRGLASWPRFPGCTRAWD